MAAIDPQAFKVLSMSNLTDHCTASAVPIMPIAPSIPTLRKVRPTHGRDAFKRLRASKSLG